MKKLLKYLLFPLAWLWRSFFFINAVITFFLFFPFFAVLLMKKKWFPLVFRLKKIWAHFILFPTFIFYRIESQFVPKKGQAYVFCPNHTSYLDIMLIYISIPNYFHTIGKAELRKVPFFGRFFDKMNIPVNRKSKMDSHRAFLRAASDVREGISVTLFPEGTIVHNGPTIGRFKNGPFRLAIQEQVPVVPVTFLNNWDLLPDDFHRYPGHPGIAKVIVHEPIPTLGMKDDDIEELKAKVFEAMAAPLRKKYPLEFSAEKHKVQGDVRSRQNLSA
ncbi:MAG: 1-acyl-sn-glycerol-3-phosphate acyltransferase [Bacteroidetes bacterium]|nr:MAG: 1-acyl-sn-glycerol-3-phosphate acyltransferase [Bacteroidota bacterium]REK00616.1 MAG: 1-acyl-sn-glycerol-3-phosphate acyltransferase [Bacteroidota bacterium]REK35262.1 MAG: 1-acyl-sn-glycerol-3-phosphate acyltransferase [Bacteroidota bacterium]REK48338.1 MAG: 1-acyl-sn-glycerol-3-phosphate acyltransferase [Bacteroidota bacterium]